MPNIFQKIVVDKLTFLSKRIICDEQHGFMPGRSTTNLAVFNSYVTAVLDSDGQVNVVYTDFSKVFDSVNHRLLLSKLEQIGFRSSLLS